MFEVKWMYEFQHPQTYVTQLSKVVLKDYPSDVRILICDSGDYSIHEHICLLPNIKKLYTTNCNVPKHEKFQGIPYGTLQPQVDVVNTLDLPTHKERLAYCNFGTGSNRSRPGIWKHMLSKPFVLCEKLQHKAADCTDPKVLTAYWCQLATSKFVICPPGNGPDTYRMWETLFAGSIPIVINSPMIEHFTDDLPILAVGTYDNLTEEFLEQEYERINSINYPKLFLQKQYWIDRWIQDLND